MARGRGYVQNARVRLERAQARVQGRGAAGGGAPGRGRRSGAPFDSRAQRELSELGNEAADRRAELGGQLSQAENNLGFGQGASNPYSQQSELTRQAEATRRGITNTAGNQLYAGSTANAQSTARSEADRGQKALEGEEAQAQAAYAGGIARTNRDYQQGALGAREGAIERAAATTPPRLGVGPGRGRAGGGARPINERQNVRRPATARQMNARARAINARLSAGRGR